MHNLDKVTLKVEPVTVRIIYTWWITFLVNASMLVYSFGQLLFMTTSFVNAVTKMEIQLLKKQAYTSTRLLHPYLIQDNNSMIGKSLNWYSHNVDLWSFFVCNACQLFPAVNIHSIYLYLAYKITVSSLIRYMFMVNYIHLFINHMHTFLKS